jgi:hypothetical protein
MSERACARCGTPVGPDEYLCWNCRQELPANVAAAAEAEDAAPGEAARTFRGSAVPEGMVLPSRVQYHGTVLGLIAVGIVIVLSLGVLVSTGVGPFIASGISAHDTGGGASGTQPFVTGTVTNRGDHAGKARCVALYTSAAGGQVPTQSVETGIISAHGTAHVAIVLPPGSSTHRASLDCK